MAKKPSKPESEASNTSSSVVSLSPKLKAFTVEKKGTGDWRVVTYEVQDDKILSKSEGEGGNKAHSLERMKILIAKEFFLGR